MRVEEAREIAAAVARLRLPLATLCLNIGSSTGRYRTVDKPHIYTELISPLEQLGVRIIHIDIKAADGVDLVGDVLDPNFQRRLRAMRAGLLLCCNLLEHLDDPHAFARACGELVSPGGFMVVSVPYSYPRHEDPIDNMLRPSPDEISRIFPSWSLRAGKIIECESFLSDSLAKNHGALLLLKHIGRVLLPFFSKGKWRPQAHRLCWLFRSYKISLAVLQKPVG